MKKKISKDAEDFLLNSLIITLIIGIFVTIIFLFLTIPEPVHFIEIYFNNHTKLPSDINLNNQYNFSVNVNSYEFETKNFEYSTYLELYNIYDVSKQEFFDCSRLTRQKIYYSWYDVNDTDYKLYDVIGYDDDEFKGYFSDQDRTFSDYILTGDKYKLDFILVGYYGNGSFTMNFVNETNIMYRVVLSEKNQTAYVIIGNETLSEGYINISTKKRNPISLDINDNKLNLSINSKQVLYTEIDDFSDGWFTYEMKNGYYGISRPLVYDDYKKSELVFSGQNVYQSIKKIDEKKIDEIDFRLKGEDERIRYNLSLNYFINATNIDFDSPFFSQINLNALAYKDNQGLYPMLYDWAGFEYPITDFPSYVYESIEQNFTREKVDFDSFNLSFKFDAKFGEKQMSMYFYDYNNATKYMFLISQKKSVYIFVKFLNNTLEITRKKIQIEEKPHTINMYFDEKKNLMISSDKTEIMKIYGVTGNFSDISIESKNSYTLISNLEIINNDDRCNDKTYYGKCYKKYNLQGERPVSMYQDVQVEFTPEFDLQNVSYNVSETRPNIEFSWKDIFTKEEQEQLIEKENPYIEDKNIVLDGTQSKFVDQNNYSMIFKFRNLDGQGINYIGFKNFNDSDVLKVIMFEDQNKIIIQTKKDNISLDYNIENNIKHTFIINYKYGQLDLLLDDYLKVFYTINEDYSNGYYYIGTESTYANFDDIEIRDEQLGIVKRFNINQDPCSLRLIDRHVFEDDIITLEPDEKRTFNYNFTIDKDFDYGKVTSTLKNKNESVHFWIVR